MSQTQTKTDDKKPATADAPPVKPAADVCKLFLVKLPDVPEVVCEAATQMAAFALYKAAQGITSTIHEPSISDVLTDADTDALHAKGVKKVFVQSIKGVNHYSLVPLKG